MARVKPWDADPPREVATPPKKRRKPWTQPKPAEPAEPDFEFDDEIADVEIGLDESGYSRAELEAMTVKDLRLIAVELGVKAKKKSEYVALILKASE